MIAAIVLAALAVALFGPAGTLLARARWTTRAPRAGVVLWQAIGLAGALAAIGAGLSVTVAPFRVGLPIGVLDLVRQGLSGHPLRGLGLEGALGLTLATDVTGVLVGGLVVTAIRTLRNRARHRLLLDLVSHREPIVPGAEFLEDPRAAAYCVPGLRSRIVVSTGTLAVMSRSELGAVMAHEEGHVRGHHGIVMLPFASMDHLLGWLPYAHLARRHVGALLEMAADDHALRAHDRRSLVGALLHMTGDGPVPACGLAAGVVAVATRVDRILADTRSRPVAFAMLGAAAAIVAAPLTPLLVPTVLR